MKILLNFFFQTILFFYSAQNLAQWLPSGNLAGLGTFPRIQVVDSNVVWCCGGSDVTPKIWRTINGGVNWISVNTTGLPSWLFTIYAKDSLNAFVGDAGSSGYTGGNSKLFKTTNGGLNWIFVDSTGGSSGWISGIVFSKTNPNFGFAVSDPPNGPGTPFYIAKTTNGGFTWSRGFLPGIFNTLTLGDGSFCVDSLFYGFLIIKSDYTDSTRVYYTVNGGANWLIQGTTPSFGSDFGGFCDFNTNKTTGIFINSGMLPNIAKTTDGGYNWNIVNSGINGTGNSVIKWITGTNTVFATCENSPAGNYVFRSSDNGITWNAQQTPPGMQNIIDAGFQRNSSKIYGFVVTGTGSIFKTTQDTMIIGIHTTSNEVPSEFTLYQNYPNPFNPVTTIRFDLPDAKHVILTIFDLLGKKITELVNEELKAGTYEIKWNALDYSSGVYFCKLSAGSYTQTMKMILNK